MADEFIPELTLNPNSPLGSQAQAAPPKGAEAPQQPASAPQDGVPDTDLDEAKLTPAQRKAVEAFAKTIDITDSNWFPTTSIILSYTSAESPIEIPADIMPIIIPSARNGPLMNQLVAPTYFIMLISLALLNTVSLMVLDTTTIETIIRNTITIMAAIWIYLVALSSLSTVSL